MRMSLAILCAACLHLSLALVKAQESSGLTPAQAWQRLKDGNDRFAADKPESKDIGAKKRGELVKGQRPFAAVLSCADSRVPPEYIFDQGLGDIFVMRVAGNFSDASGVASLEYAVKHFQVPLIVVLGHEDCGAVKAALANDKPGGDLGKLLEQIHIGKDLPMDKNAALVEGTKNNVRFQTDVLTKRSEVLRDSIEQKRLQIVSGVYSLASGRVEWLK
jgi:carbonic anhydrase